MGPRGPGKPYRKSISLVEAIQKFGGQAQAETWLVERRWPDGIRCIGCDSERVSTRRRPRRTPVYHCNACKKDFTVETGTIMHDSKLPLSTWALAFYLFSTNLKGVSSMKLHRDLGITVKTAWHLAHRIRETWNDGVKSFSGPVEVDETFMGGKERNKDSDKRLRQRGHPGKSMVLGIKDRSSGNVRARVIFHAAQYTLHSFIRSTTEKWGNRLYRSASRILGDERVRARVHQSQDGEYVRRQAHTNGIESFWSMLKRGHDGVYHHMSVKHLWRYVAECSGRHNIRPLDTEEQMARTIRGGVGKRLRYDDLVA